MQSLTSRLYYFIIKRKLKQMRALNLPLPVARALGDKNAPRLFKMPSGIATELTQIQSLDAEWLRPETGRGQGILLYLHGGAYVQGSVKSSRALAARLAKASRTATLSLGYRLAPENPFPAGLDDAFAVYCELLTAYPGQPIALVGDSAGGGLCLALAMRLRDAGVRAPAGMALLSPWTDLTLRNPTHASKAAVDPFFVDRSLLDTAAAAYAASHDRQHPSISPQFARLHDLPSTLIHVGDLEALLDDALILARRMTEHGTSVELKVYSGMWHVWQIFGGKFREADQSLFALGAFLHARLNP